MPTKKYDTVLALSGGVDSTTLLARLIWSDRVPFCICFSYGSKQGDYDIEAATKCAKHYSVPLQVIEMREVFQSIQSDLLRSGGKIPEGDYTDESKKKTIVPARNIIFISILAGIAESKGANRIAMGIESGIDSPYPDCRVDFCKAMAHAIRLGTEGKVGLHTPFSAETKEQVIHWGLSHDVPYHLTHTCYQDMNIACGCCSACIKRLLAFHAAGETDPISYQDIETYKGHIKDV